MKRDYDTGTADSITFFTGVEVEKTPAFGLKTLFVTGVQPCDVIQKHYDEEQCEHIFFGANHSFKPFKNKMFKVYFNHSDMMKSVGIMMPILNIGKMKMNHMDHDHKND